MAAKHRQQQAPSGHGTAENKERAFPCWHECWWNHHYPTLAWLSICPVSHTHFHISLLKPPSVLLFLQISRINSFFYSLYPSCILFHHYNHYPHLQHNTENAHQASFSFHTIPSTNFPLPIPHHTHRGKYSQCSDPIFFLLSHARIHL